MGLEDIKGERDIEFIVRTFYKLLFEDDGLGELFHEVVGDHLETHIPVLVNFWNANLFNKGRYQGDMVGIHRSVHLRHTIDENKMKRWLALFSNTIFQHYEGPMADKMLQNAKVIGHVLLRKIYGDNQLTF